VFRLKSEWVPSGDQPKAIEQLTAGLIAGEKTQVLLGITGSGKTYTMANVIAAVQKPTLIIAHNKTLAAQLYQEFKAFFPENAVEYFVSYYDYYQPEAYIARTDTYIEKDMAINDTIDKMRLSATRSLLERSDVIIVASVSCIYGLGSPEYYRGMNLELKLGKNYRRDDLLMHLVEMQYTRNDIDFARATFRVRGDIVEIFPAYEDAVAIRLEFFGEDLERMSLIDPLTGKVLSRIQETTIYPGSHHVTPEEVREGALGTIKEELVERIATFERENRLVERQRIEQRTRYDLEMIREVGTCKGIENYSRHFSRRKAGEPSACLLDYFPKDFLLFVDESHQTMPQIRAMYHGDRSRKEALVDFGFRLPSAFDNRPLTFDEFYLKMPLAVYVSATPAAFEIAEAKGKLVEQLIRPTGLLDPLIEVRPAENQVDDALHEIDLEVKRSSRVLVTALTKRLSEDLTRYLEEMGVRAKYLHSDIATIERMQIIQDLRTKAFDVLVGVNLLREGLDIPEVSLIVILDADKEGFLRSTTSLIQTCGRAARNERGRVIMYADKMTASIQETLEVTRKRRIIQEEHNKKHGITPRSVSRPVTLFVQPEEVEAKEEKKSGRDEHLTEKEILAKIAYFEKEMKKAAKEYRFEEAAQARDEMRYYQSLEVQYGSNF